jgi:hypothetical protein
LQSFIEFSYMKQSSPWAEPTLHTCKGMLGVDGHYHHISVRLPNMDQPTQMVDDRLQILATSV